MPARQRLASSCPSKIVMTLLSEFRILKRLIDYNLNKLATEVDDYYIE